MRIDSEDIVRPDHESFDTPEDAMAWYLYHLLHDQVLMREEINYELQQMRYSIEQIASNTASNTTYG